LDLNPKNLNHFTGICKKDSRSQYEGYCHDHATTLNHEKVSTYCALYWPLSESKVSDLPLRKLGTLDP